MIQFKNGDIVRVCYQLAPTNAQERAKEFLEKEYVVTSSNSISMVIKSGEDEWLVPHDWCLYVKRVNITEVEERRFLMWNIYLMSLALGLYDEEDDIPPYRKKQKLKEDF